MKVDLGPMSSDGKSDDGSVGAYHDPGSPDDGADDKPSKQVSSGPGRLALTSGLYYMASVLEFRIGMVDRAVIDVLFIV